MKCKKCGYSINYDTVNWEFTDYGENEPDYDVIARRFDPEILTQIINHANSLPYKPELIYISLSLASNVPCDECAWNTHLTKRLGEKQSKIEIRFYF